MFIISLMAYFRAMNQLLMTRQDFPSESDTQETPCRDEHLQTASILVSLPKDTDNVG